MGEWTRRGPATGSAAGRAVQAWRACHGDADHLRRDRPRRVRRAASWCCVGARPGRGRRRRAARQRRLRDGHPRDQHRDRAGRRGARPRRRPARRGHRRARPGLHPPARAGRRRASSAPRWWRSRSRSSGGCATARSRTARRCSPTSGCRIVNADILMAIAEARDTHDLLLLDVDNGPGYLVHDGNADVYGRDFLARCRDVLNRRGRARRLVGGAAPRAARRAGGRLRRGRGAGVRRAAPGPARGVLPLRRPAAQPRRPRPRRDG